jgi:hypothetical protein
MLSPETLRRVPLWVAIVAALLLGASGLGARFGLWHFSTGFQLMAWAAYVGLAAAAAAIVMFFFARFRTGGLAVLLCAVLVGAMVAAVPIGLRKRAYAAPLINEVTTEREKASPLQLKGYPDIQPLFVDAPPGGVFVTAKAVAQEMGWEVTGEDPKAGTLAAVATTFWFGFKDDVVVRISEHPEGGTQVDVRSVSRVGQSDVGTNAARIEEYLDRLSAARG